jgi:hypothetical protein
MAVSTSGKELYIEHSCIIHTINKHNTMAQSSPAIPSGMIRGNYDVEMGVLEFREV